MLDTKQLQYFVTAAECDSFSEAAGILFTTQSNVSKTVALLEKHLGYPLFQRGAGGIQLTPRGKAFYKQASPLVDYMKNLEAESREPSINVFRISTNPSSWFAHRFSDFYALHEQEKIHYHVHTDSTANIIRRVRDLKDDIGFVYVFPEELENFNYDVKRFGLNFTQLGETTGLLYVKPYNEEKGINAGQDLSQVSLVQGEMDTYREAAGWMIEENGRSVAELPVAVTTNSDYIMNIMMKRNGLWNVSMKTFSGNRIADRGYALKNDKGKIVYGVLKGADLQNKALADEFIDFIEGYIKM